MDKLSKTWVQIYKKRTGEHEQNTYLNIDLFLLSQIVNLQLCAAICSGDRDVERTRIRLTLNIQIND